MTSAPPPPPPPAIKKFPVHNAPNPPAISPTRPEGAYLVELISYNGSPFKDHWAYWVSSSTNSDLGASTDAAGDVRTGFTFQVQRSLDLSDSSNMPSKRIPLQWVHGEHFDEGKMLNGGVYKVDNLPVCGFEESAYKVEVPERSLNAVEEMVSFSFLFLFSFIYCQVCFPLSIVSEYIVGGYQQRRQENHPAKLPDMDCRIGRPARQGWYFRQGGCGLSPCNQTMTLYLECLTMGYC